MTEKLTPMTDAPQVDAVLDFWFADSARWWKKEPTFDADVRLRFADLHSVVELGERDGWLETPRGTLAYVIVLDQFSRNMFRDTPRAFASDNEARRAARFGLERGHDGALSKAERAFLYMPFMHSEELADQERAVELFSALGEPGSLRFAEQHRDIVQRFGRFPHRNAILGRTPTPEELEFLTQPGSSF